MVTTNERVLEAPLEFDIGMRISEIAIVGAGGTGSQIIRSVARMVYDMKQRGLQHPSIRLIDPDTVEQKNVGRQMFTPSDIGQYKVAVLGRRFNLQLGLNMSWHTEHFDHERHISGYRHSPLIIGCVDNHEARRSIAEADQLWIDCGNHFDSGQVIVGNTSVLSDVRAIQPTQYDAKTKPYMRKLPNAGLIFPDLLEPEAEPQPEISCADLTHRGDQHLLINDTIANVAATYIHALLHRQPITTFATFVNLNPYQIKGEPITASALSRYVDGIALE